MARRTIEVETDGIMLDATAVEFAQQCSFWRETLSTYAEYLENGQADMLDPYILVDIADFFGGIQDIR